MIIIGIDPGTRITGYGIIKYNNNSFIRIASGSINLPADKPIPKRLEIIYSELNKIIKRHKPDEFAIENFEPVRRTLVDKNFAVENASLQWIAKNMIEVKGEDAEKVMKMIEALEDLDDVQNVYSNADIVE